jgi:Histidine phosphatase superfamily (branch 1)
MGKIPEDHLEEEARRKEVAEEGGTLDLYVVRHAIAYERDAERWPDDARRPLTPEGEERFREAVKGLTSVAAPEVEVVLSSPFTRAWRTAEILAEAGWSAPVECEQLEPDYPPHKMDPVLEHYAGAASVAVVGRGGKDQERRRRLPPLRRNPGAGRGHLALAADAQDPTNLRRLAAGPV